MPWRTGLALLIIGLHSLPTLAGGDGDLGKNAALKYWQAFATLPALTDGESRKLRSDALSMPLDSAARALIDRAGYSLQLLHHGAAEPACDWGVGYEEGIVTRLPQAPAAGVLCSLACLRARLRIEEKRPNEAVDDLVAAMALARHLSMDSGLVVLLVAYNLEHSAGEAMAASLPRLDSRSLGALQTRLRLLPTGGRPAEMLRFEETSLEWLIRKVGQAPDREALVAIASMLVDGDEGRSGESRTTGARAFLDECGGTAAGLLEHLEALRPAYARVCRMLDLPPDDFAREWTREQARYAANPAFRRLFAPYPRIRRAHARASVRRALLAAAVDVQIHGRDAIRNHPDPGGGRGLLEYVPSNGGFVLRSTLLGANGNPLSLAVGP